MYRVSHQLRYSQNLINPLVARRLVEKCAKNSFSQCDIIIEIGAGEGALTVELARSGKKVLAYEIDPIRQKVLKKRFEGVGNVDVICEDFLKSESMKGRYCVVSNLPFNITSAILRKLIWAQNPPQFMYLIMQKEAAQRYLGTPRETQISLLVKPLFSGKIICPLCKSDFFPKPRIKCVFVKFSKIAPIFSESEYKAYCAFVTKFTSNWKNSAKKSFSSAFTYKQLKRLSKDLGFNLTDLPLDLSYEVWLGLFRFHFQR